MPSALCQLFSHLDVCVSALVFLCGTHQNALKLNVRFCFGAWILFILFFSAIHIIYLKMLAQMKPLFSAIRRSTRARTNQIVWPILYWCSFQNENIAMSNHRLCTKLYYILKQWRSIHWAPISLSSPIHLRCLQWRFFISSAIFMPRRNQFSNILIKSNTNGFFYHFN